MPNINLYNTDCMHFMQSVPDKFYDLAIVDPPYGIGESGSSNHSRSNNAAATKYKDFAGGDKETMPKEFFEAIFRISKNQIVWGANHYISRLPINSPCWIVWDKRNEGSDFADCELAWTSFKGAVRKLSFMWNGMLQENMKNKEVRIHPTQKPVALYRWLLDKYAKPGDKILDTHAGSFSIGIACHDLGFDLDACELDEHYFKLAISRYNNHIKQLSIF